MPEPNRLKMPNYCSLLERLALLGQVYEGIDQVTIAAGQSQYYAVLCPESPAITILRRAISSFDGNGIRYIAHLNPTSYVADPTPIYIPPRVGSEVFYTRASSADLTGSTVIAYDELPLLDTTPPSTLGSLGAEINTFQPLPFNSTIILELKNESASAVEVTADFVWAEGNLIESS